MRERRKARLKQNHATWLALGTFCALALAWVAHAQPSPDQISVQDTAQGLSLSWSDTENALKGAVQPRLPRAGQPLRVAVTVGNIEGAEFAGPVTFTLRKSGETFGQTFTVISSTRSWSAMFDTSGSGTYLLDVSFRTTRLKVLHAHLQVGPPVWSTLPWLVVLGLFGLGLLFWGARRLLQARDAQESQPPPP